MARRGGAALRILHSDADLHRALSGDDPVERVLFEMLEQLRCESLAPPAMRGVVQNLRHRFEMVTRVSPVGAGRYACRDSRVHRRADRVVAADGWPVLEDGRPDRSVARGDRARDRRATRETKRCRHDQRAFAEHALALAKCIAAMIRDARAAVVETETEDAREQDDALTNFSLWVDFDETGIDMPALVETGDSVVLQGGDAVYRARRATTASFDRPRRSARHCCASIATGSTPGRRAADQRHAASPRAARALVVPQADGWSFGEEQGRLDGRRLAQLVSSPAERRLFRLERVRPCRLRARVPDRLLRVDEDVDRRCRADGRHAGPRGRCRRSRNRSAGLHDARLERRPRPAGVARARQAASSGPAQRNRPPGVQGRGYPLAAARTGIAALFKADLFREGVDGEAVEWACARLAARPEARKILVVISDGSPMDGATALANDPFYLDNHLKQVVARQSRRAASKCSGWASADLGPYYRHRLAIDLASALDMKRLVEIAGWIGARR